MHRRWVCPARTLPIIAIRGTHDIENDVRAYLAPAKRMSVLNLVFALCGPSFRVANEKVDDQVLIGVNTQKRRGGG